MPNIDELVAKLDKETREYAMKALDIQYERQEVPSLKLQAGLKGGLAYGRIHTVWGAKAAGKSSFCLQLIANAQKKGKTCVYIDAERTFDPEWAKRLGADVEELIVLPISSINKVTNSIIDLCKHDADLIVVDSITSLIPASYMEKDGDELKPMEKTGAIGGVARDLSRALPMIVDANKDTMIVLISQSRTNINPTYAKQELTGGRAVSYYSSNIIKLWSSDSAANQITGETFSGDRIYSKPIGREVNFVVEHSKTSSPGYSGSYEFYYDGPFVGIDTIGEVIDLAVEYGIVRKGGAWYNYGEEKWQGKQGFRDALIENPELYHRLKEEVLSDGEEHTETSEPEYATTV